MDINPATRGHALVVPRRHTDDLLEIGDADLAACTAMARRVAARAKDVLGADGVNLLNCCGAAAWQTVFHFHLHVVPATTTTRCACRGSPSPATATRSPPRARSWPSDVG